MNSLLHLGTNTFDELNGEVVQNVAFTFSNHKPNTGGTYYRLVKGNNCEDKRLLFLENEEVYNNVFQTRFLRIPGYSMGYWISDTITNLFGEKVIDDYVISKAGVVTGDDKFFVRNWFEVNNTDICFNPIETDKYRKYYPFCKGGSSRRYYGNFEYVIKLRDLWDENH